MATTFKGIQVVPRPNEPVDQLIRRFTKAVRNSEILDEYRMRQSFEKPSDKRRRKHRLALWKNRTQE